MNSIHDAAITVASIENAINALGLHGGHVIAAAQETVPRAQSAGIPIANTEDAVDAARFRIRIEKVHDACLIQQAPKELKAGLEAGWGVGKGRLSNLLG